MKTILLIEDNRDILENMTEYLELEGYRVISTDNGLDGIKLAIKHMPDLVVCDIYLPKVDGYKVLRKLTFTTKTSKIPLVFNTCMSEKRDKLKAIKLGASDYLVKPFDLEILLEVIQRLIKKVNIKKICSLKELGFSSQVNIRSSQLTCVSEEYNCCCPTLNYNAN